MNTVTLSPSTYAAAALYAKKMNVSVDQFVEQTIINATDSVSEPEQKRDYFTLSELKGIVSPDPSGKSDKQIIEECIAEKYGL